jgi:hypothetical protein
MADKQNPIGICDLCGDSIPSSRWYTSKGKPRLYCTRTCRNTANSRNGNPIRIQKQIERVARGEWQNPARLRSPTPEEQSARARKGRLREVEAGTWRNPALGDSARQKLSRPRKYSGALHSAIEKLKRGLSVSELTAEEHEAHKEYQRQLRAARRYEINRLARERYHRKKDEHGQQ